jgi:hypothetical protein
MLFSTKDLGQSSGGKLKNSTQLWYMTDFKYYKIQGTYLFRYASETISVEKDVVSL